MPQTRTLTDQKEHEHSLSVMNDIREHQKSSRDVESNSDDENVHFINIPLIPKQPRKIWN